MTLLVEAVEGNTGFRVVNRGAKYFQEGEYKMLSLVIGSRKVRASDAQFYFPSTSYHAAALRDLKLEMSWQPEALLLRDVLLSGFGKFAEALSNGAGAVGFKLQDRELFPHQKAGITAVMLRQKQRVLIADEMGLGKSTLALAVFNESNKKRLLIVCPASVKYNWIKEVDAVLGPTTTTFAIPSDAVKRKRFLHSLLTGWAKPDVLITNYDLLRDKNVLANCQGFVKGQFAIFDESHYVKDEKSLRSQHCRSLEAEDLLLLTGTPVRNLITDLYHQLVLIEPRLFRNVWEFQDHFTVIKEMNVGSRKIRKVVGTKNQAHLRELLAHYQIRRLKADVLDLPLKIRTVVELDLDKDARKSYEAMRKDWIYTFGGLPDDANIFDVRVQSAIEQALRLEQICQGYLRYRPEKVDNLAERHTQEEDAFFGEAAKLTWLLELVEDMQAAKKKLVVFFKFNRIMAHVVGAIQEESDQVAGVLQGSTPADERPKILEAFEKSETGILCAQVKIAEGWNAQHCQDVVFFGRDWSPAVNAQAEDRLHRIGQRGTVNVYIPLIRNSVESYIHERLEAKAKDASVVLGDSPLVFKDLKDAIRQGEQA